MSLLKEYSNKNLRTDIPDFGIGDTIRVLTKIIEGGKERVQAFQGTVIARKGHGIGESISLHRIAYSEGMEKTLLLHSPKIVSIEIIKRGKVRRAKLYYLRGTKGKAAKVREKIVARRAPKVSQPVESDVIDQQGESSEG